MGDDETGKSAGSGLDAEMQLTRSGRKRRAGSYGLEAGRDCGRRTKVGAEGLGVWTEGRRTNLRSQHK